MSRGKWCFSGVGEEEPLYEEVVTINSRRWLNTKQHLRTHLRP